MGDIFQPGWSNRRDGVVVGLRGQGTIDDASGMLMEKAVVCEARMAV